MYSRQNVTKYSFINPSFLHCLLRNSHIKLNWQQTSNTSVMFPFGIFTQHPKILQINWVLNTFHMSSSSSSDCENCNYYQCYSLDNNYDAYNYGRPVRSSRHVPFYSTVGHPLIYYAEVVSRLIHTPPSMYQHFPYSLLLGKRITTNFCQTLF